MAQPITVSVTGAVNAAPASSTALVPSLMDMKPFGLQRTYNYRIANSFSVNNPLIGSPFTVPLGSITKVRFIAMSIVGAASMQLLVTSAAGADQTFKVSELLLWSAPTESDQMTAIKLVGIGDVELILLGD